MVKALSYGIFPDPFPDETCYSLLCRYAVRRGLFTGSQICMDLFGYTEPLSGYLFKPFRLKDLERWFAGRDMTVTPDYGMDHSCYPFFTAFLQPYDAEMARGCRAGSALTTGQAKRLNGKCGFPKNHKRSLWYCPICVREDLAKYGETCWRRLPQMPGAVYCPVHREPFRESGVGFREINYRIIPATYAVFHIPEPEQEYGTVYVDRYIALSADMAWLLESEGFIPNWEWLTWTYSRVAGRQINAHLLYSVSRSFSRGNRFEDYLANRIMKDSGKERIDEFVSRHVGSILSIEKAFGSIEKFLGSG